MKRQLLLILPLLAMAMTAHSQGFATSDFTALGKTADSVQSGSGTGKKPAIRHFERNHHEQS